MHIRGCPRTLFHLFIRKFKFSQAISIMMEYCIILRERRKIEIGELEGLYTMRCEDCQNMRGNT